MINKNNYLITTNCLYKKTDTGHTPYRQVKNIFKRILTRKGSRSNGNS